jgi:hypothetical protein
VASELRQRLALAEEQLADLKAALEDMRAQRDAWQEMAQARIRAPASATSRWSWLARPDERHRDNRKSRMKDPTP